tara:strand:+ start:317 stop:775 length:459 start_codon:yes stop_codon:yes gene_type:complete
MSGTQSNLLFYVVQNNTGLYYLFNRMTDHVILSEVNEDEIENFLKNNNPLHPLARNADVREGESNYFADFMINNKGVSTSQVLTPYTFEDTVPSWDDLSYIPKQTEDPQLEFDFGDYINSLDKEISKFNREDDEPQPPPSNELPFIDDEDSE